MAHSLSGSLQNGFFLYHDNQHPSNVILSVLSILFCLFSVSPSLCVCVWVCVCGGGGVGGWVVTTHTDSLLLLVCSILQK